MKAISNGNIFDIYDDTLQTYDKLPAQVYSLRFSKNQGFFLEKHADVEILEEKIYGVHQEKIDKVIRAFDVLPRNLGTILSGPKGIGKSLFAKLLAKQIVAKGMPVILIDTYYQGLTSYIESIEQEAMVLFDEFDKTFSSIRAKDGEAGAETELLTLFDGMSAGKKLYVVTCNEVKRMSEYFINRPGRFHFHFRFENPTAPEIEEYLHDKLKPEFYDQIRQVVEFSRKIGLNYDCLRAIAFELNMGYPFKDAITDLNIINMQSERYNIFVRMSNGYEMYCKDVGFDLFDEESSGRWFGNKYNECAAFITFSGANSTYDSQNDCIVIEPKSIKIEYEGSDLEEEVIEKLKKESVESCIVRMMGNRSMHYKLV